MQSVFEQIKSIRLLKEAGHRNTFTGVTSCKSTFFYSRIFSHPFKEWRKGEVRFLKTCSSESNEPYLKENVRRKTRAGTAASSILKKGSNDL